MTFFAVLNSDYKAFGSKKLCWREQDQAAKDTFLIIQFTIHSVKSKMSHGGRVDQKRAKRCHVLFELSFESFPRLNASLLL